MIIPTLLSVALASSTAGASAGNAASSLTPCGFVFGEFRLHDDERKINYIPLGVQCSVQFQLGEDVEGNYKGKGIWYPAKYNGPSDRPGTHSLLYDDFPQNGIRTKKDHIRKLPAPDRFRSALGEDLTALVLQYAMYNSEAIETLVPDGTLAHLYSNHTKGFEYGPGPGVEVIGAGSTQVNGWYRRREAAECPPVTYGRNRQHRRERWIDNLEGLPWYEKDDGCYIYWHSNCKKWWCRDADGNLRYSAVSDTALPPHAGWRVDCWRYSVSPAPTLRVVS